MIYSHELHSVDGFLDLLSSTFFIFTTAGLDFRHEIINVGPGGSLSFS